MLQTLGSHCDDIVELIDACLAEVEQLAAKRAAASAFAEARDHIARAEI